nr:AAA family ATPase [Roseococcus sp. MDT2-1-1]
MHAPPAVATDPMDQGEVERHAPLAGPMPALPVPDARGLRAALDREFPWLADATRAIAREVALLPDGAPARLPPLLLAGPPGLGKSTFARRVLEICGLPHRLVTATEGGGATLLGGHGRGWRGGRPALPLGLMAQSGLRTVGIVVDDVDRQGSADGWGTPQGWLLAVLEPATAQRYWDPFLLTECDLTGVSWVLTANDLSSVSGALKDRCLVVEVGYPPPDAAEMVVDGLLARLAAETGQRPGPLRIPAAAREVMVRGFAADPSTLRALARVVRLVCGAARLGEDPVAVARAGLAAISQAEDRPYAARRLGFGRR